MSDERAGTQAEQKGCDADVSSDMPGKLHGSGRAPQTPPDFLAPTWVLGHLWVLLELSDVYQCGPQSGLHTYGNGVSVGLS